MGVFGKEYKLPMETQNNEYVKKMTEVGYKKIHSLYFPVHWEEATVYA
jgi:hypothetical protein